jgi:hypothetical protein
VTKKLRSTVAVRCPNHHTLTFSLYIIFLGDVRSLCWFPGAFAHLTPTPDTVELAFESGFMTYPSLFPGKSPLSGSQSSTAESHFVPQSRETGEVVPEKVAQDARSVANAEPVAKPWAHFVAGGYVTSFKHFCSFADTLAASVV